jgi:hypothetical protein
LTFSFSCFADRARYDGKVDIYDTAGAYVVHHFHNWANGKENGKIEFSKNGEILFFKETAAFTYLKIFEKEKMIVLLSKIRINNPVQIEIIGFDRRVLLKKAINPDSLKYRADYGSTESITNYIFWYNEKDPELTVLHSIDSCGVKVKTPNNNFLSFMFFNDTTKGKGAAGIGYGAGYRPGAKNDSVYDVIFDPTDSTKKIVLKNRELLKNNAPDFLKGGALIGNRSKASIMRTTMENLAGLRYAYNKRLRERPGLKGMIIINFKIISSGKVVSSRSVEATLIDDIMQKDITERIANWKFDKIEQPNDTTEVTYPFYFSK